ncbi:hypothetical protein HPB49_001302 [Dermacentor silvarum]|uniref:Uncharacterized protein n=1 Tax=Dermacentor silvarum TaxID=543639 RepID=A0ACB8C0G3_DERSI|nr:hypothetical protein HPB49_001302 [Dermacentor silvarum]
MHEAAVNLLLGRRLRARLDVFKPVVGESVAYEQLKQMVNRPCRAREVTLGHHVLARNYRGQPKWMPAVVIAQTGAVSFKVHVSTPSGCFEWRRHKDQFKALQCLRKTFFKTMGSLCGHTATPDRDKHLQYHQLVFPLHHRRRRLTLHWATRIDATQFEIVYHLIDSKQEREL